MMSRKIPTCPECGENNLIDKMIDIPVQWKAYRYYMKGIPALVCHYDEEYLLNADKAQFIQLLADYLSKYKPNIDQINLTNIWHKFDSYDKQIKLIEKLKEGSLKIIEEKPGLFYIPNFYLSNLSNSISNESKDSEEEIQLAAREGKISEHDKEVLLNEIKLMENENC